MPTLETKTVTVTIPAPLARVAEDLSDPSIHPEWATEFFSGPAASVGDGTWKVMIPTMGGAARVRVEADPGMGLIDLYVSREGEPFGQPIPARVVPNEDGCDVLYTLARPPGCPPKPGKGHLPRWPANWRTSSGGTRAEGRF